MKTACRFTLFFFFFCHIQPAKAQAPTNQFSGSNWRIKYLKISNASQQIDTLSIVPGSFLIPGTDAKTYRLDAPKALLLWLQKPAQDSIQIQYRVFPFLFAKVAQRLTYDSVAGKTAILTSGIKERQSRQVVNFGNLQYNGSFGRGIAFGNNQDAVVQSNFNLQLTGYLADSIEIAAAISDNNLPIQPEGTTQQLNEFDQVFLQFRKKGWQLNLGDIDLRQTDLYFLRFYKRLQGVTFQNTASGSKKVQSATLVSGSIAKGKFTRNIFQGLEGNQGPYRLAGANNESFFIVLANTERVFIDGQLQQRGEDADYVINYNTAEISFMPRRMITKDSRIQVEFEYADRNYLNANLYAHQSVRIGDKLKLRVGAFTNADARNSPINQPLDGAQRQFLFRIGDSTQNALYPAATSDSFAKEKVLYEKVFITNSAGLDSFYRYAADTALARYALSFTDMGAGRGDYMPDFKGTNGKVFRYVAPQNGIRQGRYVPAQILVAPKKQQLISIGADFNADENNTIAAELAISNYDPNTFSTVHNGDDGAIAAKIAYTNSTHLGKNQKSKLESTAYLEHVAAKFRPLERLRQVEFSREWGLPAIQQPADETIGKIATSLKLKENNEFTYQFTAYNRSNQYIGTQNSLQQISNIGGWQIQNSVLHTRFSGTAGTGTYFKPVLNIRKELTQLSSLVLSFRYEQEKNVLLPAKDSLSPASFAFVTYTVALHTGEQHRNQYGFRFFTRTDHLPDGAKLQKADKSYNLNFESELLSNPRHQLVLSTTYRYLKVIRSYLSEQKGESTLLGRAAYQIAEWKGALTGTVLYELGTGQEQRRDFTYLEVPSGQGEYAWIDYDKDGIQELAEFEVAVFRDQAQFVRVWVPTNDYIKAAYTTFNYNFALSPHAAWDATTTSAVKKILSRFSMQTSLQTTQRSIATKAIHLNPLKQNLQDTALISENTTTGNTFSFNRQSSDWGLDLASFQTTAKALLAYGFESRKTNEWNLKGRWMPYRTINLDFILRSGAQKLLTPSFENRNYSIDYKIAEPKLSYLSGTVFRLQGSYKYERKNNMANYGGQKAVLHSLILESKYNVLQNSSMSGRFVFNTIRFNDKTASPVAYIMLDGLLPGKNLLWNLAFSKRLINNVELDFQYDGRHPARSKTVHTGRASLRALF